MARWNESFTSVVFSDKAYLPDEYKVELFFYPDDDSSLRNQKIAFERIKFFLLRSCQNSVIINNNEQDTIAYLHKKTDSKLIILPPGGDIAEILFCKLSKLAEEALIVTQVNVSSWQGDQIEVSYDLEDSISDPVLDFYKEENITPWYFDNTPKTNNLVLSSRHKSLYHTNWKSVGLDYPTKSASAANKKLSYTKNPANITSWTPRVIDGGKSEI